MVFHGIMNEGGISNVDINRKIFKFVNNARSGYVKNHKWTEGVKGSKAEVHITTKTKTAELESQIF